MTYQERTKGTTIDWRERIKRLEGELDIEEFIQWKKDAGSWVTCACGNQCTIIDRDEEGRPKDVVLKDLGVEFFYNIRDKNATSASRTLREIEIRSAFLIKQLKNEKQ